LPHAHRAPAERASYPRSDEAEKIIERFYGRRIHVERIGIFDPALLRRRTLWSRRDALALRDIARLFRVGFVDHIGRLDHGLIAP
jgi:hypothetical protein